MAPVHTERVIGSQSIIPRSIAQGQNSIYAKREELRKLALVIPPSAAPVDHDRYGKAKRRQKKGKKHTTAGIR
jgi:hypothetical protein